MKKARKQAQTSKLDRILRQQQQILRNEERISKEEARIERLEEREVSLEKEALRRGQKDASAVSLELAKLEELEREVKEQVTSHPLRKVTWRDVIKGMVGAFIGVVVHFTFKYGAEIASKISVARATALFGLTFLIGLGFLYGTGFRNIKDSMLLWLLPYRLVVLYTSALIVTTATLAFFYPHFMDDPVLAYKQVATVNLSAVVGACTADLIGRGE